MALFQNERGQVDVWSEKCLPLGTVHLRFPRLVPVCQRLGINFAPTMVGFEIRKGRSIPVYEGLVVCEEFKDAIMEVNFKSLGGTWIGCTGGTDHMDIHVTHVSELQNTFFSLVGSVVHSHLLFVIQLMQNLLSISYFSSSWHICVHT